MAFIARHRVSIDGVVVDSGHEVPADVPDARCEELVGRHLDKNDDKRSTAVSASADVEIDLDAMTVAELEAFAADLGLELPDVSKAEKLAFIKEATGE